MLPLARELLRHGTAVVLAANSAPAINDITAAELEALLPQVGAAHCAIPGERTDRGHTAAADAAAAVGA